MRIANFSRSQRMAIVQGILCIVSIIAIMQLWLFTTTMEAYLGGAESFVLTAAGSRGGAASRHRQRG